MEDSLNLKSKLIKCLIEVTGNTEISIDLPDSTDLINDVGLDSIQMINFILMMEDEFNIQIDFENFNADYLKSITILCEYIGNLQNSAVASN